MPTRRDAELLYAAAPSSTTRDQRGLRLQRVRHRREPLGAQAHRALHLVGSEVGGDLCLVAVRVRLLDLGLRHAPLTFEGLPLRLQLPRERGHLWRERGLVGLLLVEREPHGLGIELHEHVPRLHL
jgi:hypothetical protein